MSNKLLVVVGIEAILIMIQITSISLCFALVLSVNDYHFCLRMGFPSSKATNRQVFHGLSSASFSSLTASFSLYFFLLLYHLFLVTGKPMDLLLRPMKTDPNLELVLGT